MAHNTSKTGFPDIPILPGMVLRLEARDPTTNADVAGVTASRWTIYGRDESGVEIPDVIPHYSPTDAEGDTGIV